MQLDRLYYRLKELESQKATIEKEIKTLKQQISQSYTLSKEDKVILFRSLFIGREDVYATYWISPDGTKKAYFPQAYTFKGTDYRPVTPDVIRKHLEGKIRLGTYAVVDQVMAKFLVIDLDKKSFVEDARAIHTVSQRLQLSPLFEISKSGNGMHIWYFFEIPVRAVDVRRLGDMILTKAMDISYGIDMKSYDRMFPNQDFVAPDALGNLIALPLHYGSRSENKTVFVDIDTLTPYHDQWLTLRQVTRISIKQLNTILKTHISYDDKTQETLMPWAVKEEKSLVFPKHTKAILYDALYIEKADLTKEVTNRLQRMASFANPEFYIRQNLRKSTFNTPRVITSYDLNERYIILPRGLIQKVKRLFERYKAILQVEDKRFTQFIKKQQFYLKLRDEQMKAFNQLIKIDYSILIAPPGFGKTAIASAIIAKRGLNTLILVHKTTLLEQWVERLSEYFKIDQKEIGQLGKGKKRITSHIDVATFQSLKNRPELIEEYTQVIVDEVHHIPAVSFEVPLKRFRGKSLLGLSATPIRQDGMHPIMFMQCGEVGFERRQERTVTHRLISVPTTFESRYEEFALILNELAEDEERNRLIIQEIQKLPENHILILSDRIEHLNILYHMLDSKKIRSTLLHGGLRHKMQKVAIREAQDARIILSTSSYIGEGIDLPHLDTIVFTMPVSFSGRVIQYLGRIGRRGQHCTAIDFVDEQMPMLRASFNKRTKAYKKMGYLQDKGTNTTNLLNYGI
ncbi:MAG: DEAD/DEAH box helicase family protein [Sulfurovum sp.]|nr:DEAD/DEAH box helicase family protein [Sulfurovum sp.]MDD3500387.1 DEAD/DEAH box helicase family protein [Sulfurovum sp.]